MGLCPAIKGVVLPLAPIGDLKLWCIPRPTLKNMSKVPVGYIGETGANWTQVRQLIVGVGVHAKKDVLEEIWVVDEVGKLIHYVVELEDIGQLKWRT